MSVYGIDTSHWEGVIDWLQIRQDGRVKFAIHKATEGTAYIDAQFHANKAGCQSIGMPWGAFHYFRAAQNAVDQADHFVETVGTGCYVYIVDVESYEENLGNRLLEFVQRLELKHHIHPMIYTAYYFWHDHIGNVEWAAEHDLWVANYEVAQPMIPSPWTSYKIWQYSENGHVAGINAAVDEDWFNGDMQQMYNYFKNGNEVPEPPAPSRVRVNVANLTIRSAPIVTASTVLGYTTYGKIWTVEDTVKDASDKTWYKVGVNVYLAGYKWNGVLLTVPL